MDQINVANLQNISNFHNISGQIKMSSACQINKSKKKASLAPGLSFVF